MDQRSNRPDIERKREFQHSEDNFKPVFKRYKNRAVSLDLSEVVDFGLIDVCSRFEVNKRDVKTDIGDDVCSRLGLEPLQKWKAFSLSSSPGFIFIRNPFKCGHQRYWLKRLLQDVPNPTNKTNIPDGFPVSGESVWDLHCQRYPTGNKSTFSQLRWVTLGHHYNWNTKLYDPEDVSPFPEDLGILSTFVAASVGFQNFKAEAAIVNYYNMNSTLGGHNDHSELDRSAPLISFSFGQSAIFLVGGLTKLVAPTPILLRSGDIIILSSSSRLAFHGVPRILHDDPENMKRCWGVNNELERRNNKILTHIERGEREYDRTGISKEAILKQEPKVNISCNARGRDNMLMTIDSLEESEISTADGKIHHIHLPTTTAIKPLNLERNYLECDFHKEKEILSNDFNGGNDEDQRILKFRKVSSVIDNLERTESNGQFQIPKEDQTMGNYCIDGQVAELTENDHLQEYSLSTKVDSGVTDRCHSSTFPNIDDILQRIGAEMDQLSHDALWEPFEKHLQNSRLNLSVRQVNTSAEGS